MKFLQLAREGKNDWWRYLFTIILTNPGISIGTIIGIVAVYVLFGFAGLIFDLTGSHFPIGRFFRGFLDILSYNIVSAFLILLLFFCMVLIHGRDFRSVLTAHERLQWYRIFKGFFVWFAMLLLSLSFSLPDPNIKFTFDAAAYPFLFIISLTIFFQAGFEEIFFRGYLLQALNLSVRRPWLAILISSVIFAIGHWGNQLTLMGNLNIFIDTFIFALVVAVITVLEDGVETAIGIHTANNMFCALIVNDGTSSFYEPLPSLFTNFSTPSNPMDQLFYSTLMNGILLLIIVLPQGLNLLKKIISRMGGG
ncbi:MAG TPA: CPBP family intramembrane metalloprotease [Methanothermobacter sp.]|jgi:membrane protease YdiL (CAAX protease family)|uniref:CPBP family intramembrane metalloprotease n=1 Tax=Methanothermobacter tenebrarum TaxID=680118 RepID=A0ABM7YE52_9EURY|nr:type II CAAX endopeptidase family protein [Methanothermobacter tenebrarum]MDI6881396.1 type II CAAX endopeptidase family protein [Methanothermobacter sp.]MDX9693316.1 type II CAAX endopeptidase family protein [Methanothermobacter sp.]BDH79670.1 CPBP family intramembrane metalloprotease [Methanothermobacter tenebrarum]HHW16270.1 CPBP family intramembrane metalloprotease [Methanothermobacter sp.]HOQ20236.1 type II CAAX endopeptidase family protein [Methanothermobacter sp.]